ncbi:uncharacterized protein LOC116771793 isoform X2 [Danaus plexippus]|uniref:uncharacterized protein LOC116771793 isoform X2 n=1 Tax=Danaus plexippus TaxID=13037 RepID=UPI002AB2FCC1|nr:uncharacterized protein LOC116771793 isoform X2 [Danaus plexippus]
MLKIASILLLYFYQLCLGEGNFHLMEEEISNALQDCSQLNDKLNIKVNIEKRQRRHNDFRYYAFRIDANSKQEINQYPYAGIEEDLINSGNRQTIDDDRKSNLKQQRRFKRNEPLVSKDDVDKCLSQCVFANLQVVDSKGIPREAMLWNKIQSSVTSEQSETLMREQIRSCFQELQSESEDNGCVYSNRLERCLMLHISDRKRNSTQTYTTSIK